VAFPAPNTDSVRETPRVNEDGGVRDRDERGRARNARPRDAYGRPLAYGAPGGEATVPGDLVLGPEAALAEAQRLLDADRPFHAHEVLESVWKAAPEAERELWRGLAQMAVGLTHARRGNARGAEALLARAAERLNTYPDRMPYGVDLDALVRTFVKGIPAKVTLITPGANPGASGPRRLD
jgi:uncharacterized protein